MNSKSTPRAEFETISPTACRVSVSVPPDRFRSKLDSIYSDLAKNANIPGFRPGKAPRNILNRHYGKEKIISEATEDIIQDTLFPILKEKEISLVGTPRVDHDPWEDGSEFKYVATIEMVPPIPEVDYASLEAVLPRREMTDEILDGAVRRLRISLGESRQVKDRPVRSGDFLLLHFEAEVPDVMVESIEGERPWRYVEDVMEVEVGRGKALEGLEEQLIGMELEEIKEFELVLPDDFGDPRVRGTAANIKLRVLNIREVDLAELTEELVKERFREQGIESVDALREQVRGEIRANWAKMDERATMDQLEAYLSRAFDFPLPEGLVRGHYVDILDRALESLTRDGVQIEELVKPDNEAGRRMRKRARYQAERTVRLDLLIREVARKESIGVADEEVANYLMMLAYRQALREQDLRTLLKDRAFVENTRDDILKKKVSHFLIDKVKAERVPEEEFQSMMEKAREEGESHEKHFLESIEDPELTIREDWLATPTSGEQKGAKQPAEESGSAGESA